MGRRPTDSKRTAALADLPGSAGPLAGAAKHTRRRLQVQPTVDPLEASRALSGAEKRRIEATRFFDGTLLECCAGENLDALAKLAASRPLATLDLNLSWGSLCSGCEGAHFVMDAVSKAYAKRGCRLEFTQFFACEINEEKREWIHHVVNGWRRPCGERYPQACGKLPGQQPFGDAPPGICIFSDICEMHKEQSLCFTHGQECQVPYVDVLLVGVSCKDMSRASPNFAANKSVLLQEQSTGGSAQTFRGLLNFVSAHTPSVVIFENVDSIDSDSGKGKSNLDIVLAEFTNRGYEGQCCMCDSNHFGLPTMRRRLYVLFTLVQPMGRVDLRKRSLEQAFRTFCSLMGACTRAAPCVSKVLLPHDDPAVIAELHRRQEKKNNAKKEAFAFVAKAKAKGMGQTTGQSSQDAGHGPSAASSAVSWTDQHIKFSQQLGVRWGKSQEDLVGNPWFNTLLPREQDALKLSRGQVERALFRDMSQGVARMAYPEFQKEGVSVAPTILPGQSLWLEAGSCSRLVLGRESMMWQGFPILQFLEASEFVYPEPFLQNLAGNAMSLLTLLAIVQSATVSLDFNNGNRKLTTSGQVAASSSNRQGVTDEDRCMVAQW